MNFFCGSNTWIKISLESFVVLKKHTLLLETDIIVLLTLIVRWPYFVCFYQYIVTILSSLRGIMWNHWSRILGWTCVRYWFDVRYVIYWLCSRTVTNITSYRLNCKSLLSTARFSHSSAIRKKACMLIVKTLSRKSKFHKMTILYSSYPPPPPSHLFLRSLWKKYAGKIYN